MKRRREKRKEKRLRFRRTKDEIRRHLTFEEARREREENFKRGKASLAEKVVMVDLLQSNLRSHFTYKLSPFEEIPRYLHKRTYANPKDVVARIRKNAQELADQDPLLRPR